MIDYIAGMYQIKEWTREEVAELVELARRKGISAEQLSRDWLGKHPYHASYMMSDTKSYRPPTGETRRLLSLIEPIIKRMKDKP